MQRRPERLAWALRIPDPPWRALVRGKMGNRTVHRDLIFLSREGRDLGVAFQAPPGSQASS